MQFSNIKWWVGLCGVLFAILLWPLFTWAQTDSHTLYLPIVVQQPSAAPPTPPPTNQPPTVDAGLAQTVTLPGPVSLAGTVSDDGLPNPPSVVIVTWSKQSGAGAVSFANSNALNTTATFSQTGEYTLQLSANDSERIVTDTLTITIMPKNEPPVVDASENLTITLPATATLHGTVSDDGLPNPPGSLTTTWSKVSGPGAVNFGNANAADTTATFAQAGVYGLKLEATDGELASSDQITVTVRAACPQEGLWNGTNNQGRPFSFAVAHTPKCQARDVAVDFALQCQFGSATFQTTLTFPNEIKDNFFGFRTTGPNWIVTIIAHFRSETTADGTWEASMANPNVGNCSGSGTWNTSNVGTPPTATSTPTITPTASPTSTATPTPTPTATPTNILTMIPTPTSTQTPSPTSTATATHTATATKTFTPTKTPTSTFTPTKTPTSTFTPTKTPTSTITPTITPTRTPTNTPTQTPKPLPAAGAWAGNTNENQPMSFTVTADSAQWSDFKVKVDGTVFGCPIVVGITLETTRLGPGAISNNQFSDAGDGFDFAGQFTSATAATGSYAFTNFPVTVGLPFPPFICVGHLTKSGTWTASRP